MDVRIGLWRKLSAEELMLLNCGVGEDSWESLGLKEIQPVHCEGDQSWVFFGGTDAEAETPVVWPPHEKSWLSGKDSDAGRDWGQEDKGTTEDEMAGWHHWLDGRESQWTLGVGVAQGGLACCDSWGRKESDMTERLNWTETILTKYSWVTDCKPNFPTNPYILGRIHLGQQTVNSETLSLAGWFKLDRCSGKPDNDNQVNWEASHVVFWDFSVPVFVFSL